MNVVETSLAMLGRKGKDRITGASGVVSSVCFDLYGCVQVALARPLDKDGKYQDAIWHDVKRIRLLSNEAVMEVPDFGQTEAGKEGGAAEKPAPLA